MDYGTAIILKVNSSTGGTDLISYIAKEYKPTISMSQAIIIMDIVIVSLNVVFFKEIEIGSPRAIKSPTKMFKFGDEE